MTRLVDLALMDCQTAARVDKQTRIRHWWLHYFPVDVGQFVTHILR